MRHTDTEKLPSRPIPRPAAPISGRTDLRAVEGLVVGLVGGGQRELPGM